jgi:hypothetical protein
VSTAEWPYCLLASNTKKSKFYVELEGVMDWEESDIKNEKQKENDVKQNRE